MEAVGRNGSARWMGLASRSRLLPTNAEDCRAKQPTGSLLGYHGLDLQPLRDLATCGNPSGLDSVVDSGLLRRNRIAQDETPLNRWACSKQIVYSSAIFQDAISAS